MIAQSGIVACWAAVALAGDPGRPEGADRPSPAAVLAARGLRASGSVYVLPEEAEVHRRVVALRALYRAVKAAAAKSRQVERGLAADWDDVRALAQDRARLDAALAATSSVADYNKIVAQINDVNARAAAVRDRLGSDSPLQAAAAEAAEARERCLQATLDLRALVNRTRDAYAAIAADGPVRYAFASLNGDGPAKWLLGPTPAFRADVRALERVEAAVVTESVEMVEKGGVHWVNVTFNGRVTRPMVFDTGASTVVLPAAMAASIGLNPGPDDPVVRARVADGSEVEARRMVIPSVRLGRFTVKDVECLVMPAGKAHVPPLLGQSFHKHFTYTIASGTGKLVLSRVGTP